MTPVGKRRLTLHGAALLLTPLLASGETRTSAAERSARAMAGTAVPATMTTRLRTATTTTPARGWNPTRTA